MPMYCDLLTKKLIFELVTRINTHDLTISEDNWFLQIFLVHLSIVLIKNTVYSKNKKVKKHEKKIKKYTCMGLNNFHLKVNALSQVNKKQVTQVFLRPFGIKSNKGNLAPMCTASDARSRTSVYRYLYFYLLNSKPYHLQRIGCQQNSINF